MSISTVLNSFSCGIFRDEELLGVYEDICERLVLHSEVISKEDEEVFERFIEKTLVGRGLKPGKRFRHLDVTSEGEKEIKKFKTIAKTIVFRFQDVHGSSNPMIWLEKAFNEMLDHMLIGASPSDRVGIVLRNDNFPEKPIGISFRRRDQLNSKIIMATLEKVLQSNANFFAADSLRLHVDRVTLPVGNGGASRDRMAGVSYEEFCRRKRGIIVVENSDTLCLARALVLAMAWTSKDPLIHSLQLAGNLQTKERAEKLCRTANVDLSNGGTREHIQQFQHHLVDYTIVVYNNRLGKYFIFYSIHITSTKLF
ncbi:hypothetical protein RN001_010141 [Aquatica leii]|uniref:Uncharacterized protein n=1 Tax=Aquatica leii TaxID=1421715 RepID=A0AAN7SQ70_9COLE|nr:hypothetical protein RN001_010141 [Aquatica leii]